MGLARCLIPWCRPPLTEDQGSASYQPPTQGLIVTPFDDRGEQFYRRIRKNSPECNSSLQRIKLRIFRAAPEYAKGYRGSEPL
jgi:hypothetical protein